MMTSFLDYRSCPWTRRRTRCSVRSSASYLTSIRQADAFLAARGVRLETASRADLEAFMGDLLSRRAASTAGTRYKALKILYAWLECAADDAVDAPDRLRLQA